MNRLRLLFPLFLLVAVTFGCRGTEAEPGPTGGTTATQAVSLGLPTPTLASTNPPVAVETATSMLAFPTVAATQRAATLLPTPLSSPSPPPPNATPTRPPCAEPGRIEHGQLESAVAGEPMRYRVYLPPCYGEDGHTYPALYMFGGNIHDDAIWDNLGLDETAEAAITAGDIPPLLIVMPDNGWLANTTTSGPKSYEGFVLNELIPHIEATHCAWPAGAGRAVGGISRGGYWSLMMAFRRPDLFGNAGAHSPALIDSHAGPAEDPVITGATNDLENMRIWIDIGERDPYLADARPLHEALSAAGVAHQWIINPGTHEEAYWRENLYRYLKWYSDGWRIDRFELPACDVPR